MDIIPQHTLILCILYEKHIKKHINKKSNIYIFKTTSRKLIKGKKLTSNGKRNMRHCEIQMVKHFVSFIEKVKKNLTLRTFS